MTTTPGSEILPAIPYPLTMPAGFEGDLSVTAILERITKVQIILEQIMHEDVHYGTIPGCGKPSLYQPGAEILLLTFRLGARHEIHESRENGEIRIRVRCEIFDQRTGLTLGDEWGECSSLEDKYAWNRAGSDSEFDATDPDRRRVVWKKGKRPSNGGQASDYQVKQVRVNPSDVANTVLAMACKRGKVRATRAALAISSIFDVNTEDIPEGMREEIASEGSRPAPTEEQRTAAKAQEQQRDQRRAGAQAPAKAGTLTAAQDAAGEIVLTFGKHQGCKLRDVPRDYAQWIHDKGQQAALRDAAGIWLGIIKPETEPEYEAPTTAGASEPAAANDLSDLGEIVDPFAGE